MIIHNHTQQKRSRKRLRCSVVKYFCMQLTKYFILLTIIEFVLVYSWNFPWHTQYHLAEYLCALAQWLQSHITILWDDTGYVIEILTENWNTTKNSALHYRPYSKIIVIKNIFLFHIYILHINFTWYNSGWC